MTLEGITVEVALEKGPNDSVSGGDWTDLSDRVLSFSMSRGRDDRTATFDPGTISLLLDNSDDQLDPHVEGSLVEMEAGKGLPLCPIKVSDADGSRLFTGYIGPEPWQVQRARVDGVSVVRLDAMDRLGYMAQVRLPSSLFAAQLKWLAPDWWIRGIGGDVTAGSGDDLRDSSGNGYASSIVSSVGGNVMFEVASLVEGDDDSAMTLQEGVSGYTDETDLTAATANITMACIWRGTPDGVDQEIMRQRDMGSSTVRWRVECQTTGAIVATVYNSGGTPTDFVAAPANPDSGGRWDDDVAHIIFLRIEGGTRMRIWVDGQRDEVTSSIPATTTGRVIFGGGSQSATFDEVAFWTSALPTLDVNAITDAFMGEEPFNGDNFEERLQRWWDLTDHPRGVGDLQVDVGDTEALGLHGLRSMPATLLDAFRSTVESFRGVVWCRRDGVILARTYEAAADPALGNWGRYPAPLANLTDLQAPDPVVPAVRRSRPSFFGPRLDRIVNVSRVTWRDLSFSMRNDASILRYGERVREWTSEVDDVLQAVWYANGEVNSLLNFATLHLEVQPLTIDPGVDEAAATFAFADLELEVPVQLEWTTAGQVCSVEINVQSESWSWDASGCTVDLALDYASLDLDSGVARRDAPFAAEAFSYTGAAQTTTVPEGAATARIAAWGASGGHMDGTEPGYGAKVLAEVAVTPGETLQVNVGGRGAVLTGGWNGGGAGGTASEGDGYRGFGGGGATDVRQGGTALADRVVVAGGGGGASANPVVADAKYGGSAGNPGGNGQNGTGSITGGSGATSSAGGAQATNSAGTPPTAGTLGQGGAGGLANKGGGGGGGGMYGGGGGGAGASGTIAGGGGGGSCWPTTGTITDGAVTLWDDDGYLIIEWME